MNANLYANVVPLFALLLTIGYGAAAVAGQNEEERLSLLAALPVSRTAMLLQKLLTLLVLSTPVALVTGAAALLGRRYEIDLGLGALLGVTVGVVLLAFDFGALALALGCLTGSRGVSLGITSAVAAAAYVISSLAGVVDWVQRVRHLSPIYWSVGQNQVEGGLAAGSLAVLALTGLVLAGVALLAFHRLDLR